MTMDHTHSKNPIGAGILLALVAGAGGFGLAHWMSPAAPMAKAVAGKATAAKAERKPLYYYDPMQPAQHFDKPGKSPFMDMQLLPKYADQTAVSTPAQPGIQVDSATTQQLGLRVVAVKHTAMDVTTQASGVVAFNERDVAIVQSRAGGFVQRVYNHAPGDVVRAGSAIADVLVPDWGGAQAEYLAVKRSGDAALTQAARQRLVLLGMTASQIAAVDRSGHMQNVITITTPTGGVIRSLGVRSGMTVTMGQTLAEVNGINTVWLNAAVPQAQASQLKVGNRAIATFASSSVSGRITAILPEADAASRTLTVRIQLINPGGHLRPGMAASVRLGNSSHTVLSVPSEAIIRTGKRTIVMLATGHGHFQPAEVQTGAETDGFTEIIAGLAESEEVVASGQFLLDSEASLSGVATRPLGSTQ